MKTILLAAKSEAIDTHSDKIELAHVRTALDCIEISDNKKREYIYHTFMYKPRFGEWQGCMSKETLREAKNHKKILYSDGLKACLDILKSNGIELTDKFSSVRECEERQTHYKEHAAVKASKDINSEPGDDFDAQMAQLLEETQEIDTVSAGNRNVLRQARRAGEWLSERIYGQPRAIEAVVDGIKNDLLPNEKGPRATYLFLGPPATGKTFLSELMGEVLEGYEGHVKVFDMTQFSSAESGIDLFGTSRQYGNARNGQLTAFVREHPRSIIVLDEFEKANNQIQSNLLSIFSNGTMKDTCGWCEHKGKIVPFASLDSEGDEIRCTDNQIIETVDFTQTIFIITSNLGKELYTDTRFYDLLNRDAVQAETMFMDALRRETKQDNKGGGEQPAIIPELVSRFSQANIVLFDKLDFNAFANIAKKSFFSYAEGFASVYGMGFEAEANLDDFMKIRTLQYAPELDARRIKGKIGRDFFDKVTDFLMAREEDIEDCKTVRCVITPGAIAFIHEELDPAIASGTLIRKLFRKNLTLAIKETMEKNGATITYTIEEVAFERVVRIKDFKGEAGLVFDIPKTTFASIAGHALAKTRLMEIAHYLKDPRKLQALGSDIPKGMLLYGPPGTGKTMLAKAFANEADLPFLETNGTELFDLEHMKNIFEKAREYAPSIIFIDEIDSIGSRNTGSGSDRVINMLLSEMGGFAENPDTMVFVIAATNHKNNIDSAILRPGRLDLHVKIDRLDRQARRYFLDRILEKPTVGEFDMEKLLMYTTGMTGADLEKLERESVQYIIRHGQKGITEAILVEQINIIKYGERISDEKLDASLHETAIHEAGHAIISKVLMPGVQIEQVAVTPRDRSMGFVAFDPESIKGNLSMRDIRNKIAVSMAGRLAQIRMFGEDEGLDSGASNDLQQATRMAYTAIAHYGMDETLGYFNIEGIPNLQHTRTGYSDASSLKEQIDEHVRTWLKEEKERTEELIDKHWNAIEALAKVLLDNEVVFEEAVIEIMQRCEPIPLSQGTKS